MPVPYELHVPQPGHVALIGRDPGEQEEAYRYDEAAQHAWPSGRPFVGPAGVELERVLSALGLRRQDVNILNTVGERPPGNEFKAHDARTVEAGVAHLRETLQRLRPSLIITLGNEAAHTLVPDWPTSGRGIFGAKGIEERRGYFWDSPYGPVLTTLHPAGVLRKVVPGAFLLENDFKRARQWLRGKLPRDVPPPPSPLTMAVAAQLRQAPFLAWDVETKWAMDALLCSGFCGPDLVPYVGTMPRDWDAIRMLLTAPVRKVGHNGMFDLAVMRKAYQLQVRGYTDDTQHLWWALEPELAGQDETGEDAQAASGRMTRKALAFLATIYKFNIPWWKVYPPAEDPDHLEKMRVLNAVDVWMTSQLATTMLAEIRTEKVEAQYQRSIALIPFAVDVHLRGMRVDDAVRRERIVALAQRQERLEAVAHAEGLRVIEEKRLQHFAQRKQCDCCGGGRVSAKFCWRCGGLPRKPEKKVDYLPALATSLGLPVVSLETADALKASKVRQLQMLLPSCVRCGGTGKLESYVFNPFSGQQLRYLLYEGLSVPKSYQKGKEILDEAALKKVLRWCVQEAVPYTHANGRRLRA
jgi:uracil-DNA glycosylase family 4